jgi:hypothetical protein
MDSAILFGLRIGLLVLLWLFILFALNAMRKDARLAANPVTVAAAASPNVPPAPSQGGVPHQMTVVDGPMTGSRMDLGNLTEITIGRAPDCEFIVTDDFASGRHARLFKRGSEWYAEDLDSRNGTFLGGERLDTPVRVAAGSDIKIGQTVIRLVG